ncbi:MAG: NAD-dependent epimerase [Polaromonas sp.]
MSKVLVTGVAGFIGMHVARQLLARGDSVVGIDNLNDYYDPALKRSRLAELAGHVGFGFGKLDITDSDAVTKLFAENGFDRVVHLAAQAGVRHSITHPHDYVQSNLVGFLNILECCRASRIGHLVYASSSSVYGGNRKLPFSEDDAVDHPVSLYAASKKANELMAHSYSHLYGLPCSGLRFFTVYGPWGRPDMAYFSFTQAILAGEAIKVFNHGKVSRDFTYIDDIVASVLAVLDRPPVRTDDGAAPARVLNVGSSAPVPLLDFIAELERALVRKAQLNLLPMQPGDVPATFADVSRLQALTGSSSPAMPLEEGVQRFVAWYRNHYPAALAGSARTVAGKSGQPA